MPLPKIQQPTYELELPSTSEKVEYRSFLVKEEKMLLIARESNERSEIIRALRQIINNCVITPGFNVDTHPTFDLEYIFLQLRCKSVDNFVEIVVNDSEDQQTYKIKVDLSKVQIKRDEKHDHKVKINDKMGIIMSYPTPVLSEKLKKYNTITEVTYQLVLNCIKEVYDEENVYSWNEHSAKEKEEFLDRLDVESYDKIKGFFATMPTLHHEETYKNSLGNEKKVRFETLEDFFTWD
jgi:hypothetical protein